MAAALTFPVDVTAFELRVIEALRAAGYIYPRGAGPAHLSGLVWPGNERIRKGAAPGTGLVRPMLAVLKRLLDKELVRWWSDHDQPVIWGLTWRVEKDNRAVRVRK
jgi:hypothetical protein